MKTKIFYFVLVATLVCTVFQMNCKTSSEFTYLLENVEALAGNDQSGSNYPVCYHKSKVKTGYTYYDCGSCEKVYDEKAKGAESKCFY